MSDPALAARLATAEKENEGLKKQLAQAASERDLAREQLSAFGAETQSAVDQYLRLERKNTLLVQIRTATQQLLEAKTHGEVLECVLEIVANLIGCEDAAVLEADGPRLVAARTVGDQARAALSVAIGEGAIGRAAQLGRAIYGEPGALAAVPLTAGGRVVGVLALFRLLPQKAELGRTDRELLETVAGLCALALGAAGREGTRA